MFVGLRCTVAVELRATRYHADCDMCMQAKKNTVSN